LKQKLQKKDIKKREQGNWEREEKKKEKKEIGKGKRE